MVAVCAEHAFAHARVAGKVSDGDSLQAERPRGQQVKSAVPGEIIDASGGFKENDGRACGSWRIASYEPRNLGNFEIIESADKSAFDALGEEFFEHGVDDYTLHGEGMIRLITAQKRAVHRSMSPPANRLGGRSGVGIDSLPDI